MAFDGHYEEWRFKRIRAMVEHYGAGWFRGRKILEVGCGYGDIGAAFWTMGADVVFVEGREQNVAQIRARMPMVDQHKILTLDMDSGVNLPADYGKFDLVVHLGLLYHLDNWRESIAACAKLASPYMVLETEVSDSNDPAFEIKVKENQGAYDQALGGTGSRPSADFIERVLEENGFRHERVIDSRCNANIHKYDWPVTNSKEWKHGLRRFWFCALH